MCRSGANEENLQWAELVGESGWWGPKGGIVGGEYHYSRMKSVRPEFLQPLSFDSSHLSTLRELGEYRGKQELYSQRTPESREMLRRVSILESSESSNRLEGITAPRNRLKELVLKAAAPRNRSEQEIAGYRDALNLIHESHASMSLTPGLVQQLHATLYRYLPSEGGRWKPADNEIVERDASGRVIRVRFKALPAVATPGAMDELCSGYRRVADEGRFDRMILVPLAVLDFLCIHPFSDGNGRMARLLTLLLLYQANYRVGRYISLERIFEESSVTYYESLEESSHGWHDGKHDPFPWMTYFWGVLLRAYGEFEERVGTLFTGKGSKTQQVKAAVGRRLKPFAISEIEEDCPGVSRELIRQVLRELRDRGELEVLGRGRGARWRRLN